MRRRTSSVHPFLFLRRQLVPVVLPDKVSLTVVFQSYVLCYPKHIITLFFLHFFIHSYMSVSFRFSTFAGG